MYGGSCLRPDAARQDAKAATRRYQESEEDDEQDDQIHPLDSASLIGTSFEADPDYPWTATDVRRWRSGTIRSIAKMLLHSIIQEINCYGLMCDYIGYPYLSNKKDSVWDERSKEGRTIHVGNQQDLFEEVLILLWHDLECRGFLVNDLSFREEKIEFTGSPQRKGRFKWGIGLGWDLL